MGSSKIRLWPAALPSAYRIALGDEAKRELQVALKSLDYDPTGSGAGKARAVVAAHLPAPFRRALDAARRHPHPAGIVLFRNMPIDPALPATPTNGRAAARKRTHVSEGLLIGVAAHLGEPVGFVQESPVSSTTWPQSRVASARSPTKAPWSISVFTPSWRSSRSRFAARCSSSACVPTTTRRRSHRWPTSARPSVFSIATCSPSSGARSSGPGCRTCSSRRAPSTGAGGPSRIPCSADPADSRPPAAH